MMRGCTPPAAPCVDFVVVGEADYTGGLSFADIGTSLLNHNPTRAHVRPVLLNDAIVDLCVAQQEWTRDRSPPRKRKQNGADDHENDCENFAFNISSLR